MTPPIFHLALLSEWDAAQTVGRYRISTLGRTLEEEGFIHFSRAEQVEGVMRTFYSGVTEPLVLLRVDPDLLSDPVVDEEAVPGGELFPHLYGPLDVSAVISARPVADVTDLAALITR